MTDGFCITHSISTLKVESEGSVDSRFRGKKESNVARRNAQNGNPTLIRKHDDVTRRVRGDAKIRDWKRIAILRTGPDLLRTGPDLFVANHSSNSSTYYDTDTEYTSGASGGGRLRMNR